MVTPVTVTLDTDLVALLQKRYQPIRETAREMIILEFYRWALLSLISMQRSGTANDFGLMSYE